MKLLKILLLSASLSVQPALAQGPMMGAYGQFLSQLSLQYKESLAKSLIQDLKLAQKSPAQMRKKLARKMSFKNSQQKRRAFQSLRQIKGIKVSKTEGHNILFTRRNHPAGPRVVVNLDRLPEGIIVANGHEFPIEDANNFEKTQQFLNDVLKENSPLTSFLNAFFSPAYAMGGAGLFMFVSFGFFIIGTYRENQVFNKNRDIFGDKLPQRQKEFEKRIDAALRDCREDLQKIESAKETSRLRPMTKTHTFVDELKQISAKLKRGGPKQKGQKEAQLISCQTLNLDRAEGMLWFSLDRLGVETEGELEDREVKSLSLDGQNIFQRIGKTCEHIKKLNTCLKKATNQEQLKVHSGQRGPETLKGSEYAPLLEDIKNSSAVSK